MVEISQKLKRGDCREDGMIFWKQGAGKQFWVTPEKFKEQKIKQQQQSKKYYKNNKQKIIQYVKLYTERNIEKKKQYWREYIQKNQIKKKLYRKKYRTEKEEKLFYDGKKYRQSRKTHLRIYFRNYRQRHKEKIAAKIKEYHARNPGIVMEARAKNRAKRRNAAANLTNSQKRINRQIFLMARRLKQCTKINWHVDHIIPISRGGLHVPSNLMPIPEKLNLWKSARVDLNFQEWTKNENFILMP